MVTRLLLVTVLLVSACGFEPEAPIFLTGVARDEAKKPTPGLTAQLEVEPHWNAPADEPWRSIATATTDVDGRYTFAVNLGALVPGDGGRTRARAFIDDQSDVLFWATYDAELPPFEPWDAQFIIKDGKATFAPAPLREGETTSLHALELVSGTDVLWREVLDDATTLSLPSISSEGLAEPAWRLRVWRSGYRAYAPVRANASDIMWTARSTTAFIAADVDQAIPISRGRPCLVDDRPSEGCPFTDGLMQPASIPHPEYQEALTRMTIVLDAPHRVSSVVVRGLKFDRLGDLIVEGVTAAGTTVELGRAVVNVDIWTGDRLVYLDDGETEQWVTVPVESQEHVERVIVRGTFEGEPAMLWSVGEISVF